MFDSSHAVFVDPPLRGEWMAVQTPAARVPSHGTDYFAQRYAIDFIRCVEDRPKPFRGSAGRYLFTFLPASAFLAWGESVSSAFDGTVVLAADGWPDRYRLNPLLERARLRFERPEIESDYRPLTGNVVAVEGAPGVALYGHLRRGSVRVRAGQTVTAGEPLGAVGNSGRSSMPHLHFQVMTGRDPLTASAIPCGFRAFERQRDGRWEAVTNGVPGRLERIRFCGDAKGLVTGTRAARSEPAQRSAR